MHLTCTIGGTRFSGTCAQSTERVKGRVEWLPQKTPAHAYNVLLSRKQFSQLQRKLSWWRHLTTTKEFSVLPLVKFCPPKEVNLISVSSCWKDGLSYSAYIYYKKPIDLPTRYHYPPYEQLRPDEFERCFQRREGRGTVIFQGNPSGATNSTEHLYFGSAHIAGGGGRGAPFLLLVRW